MTVLKFIYLGFLLPYIVGRTWKQLLFRRELHTGVLASHGLGVLALFAVFYIFSFLPISRNLPVDVSARYFWPISFGLGAVCLVILHWRLWIDFHMDKVSVWYVILACAAITLSVACLVPHREDITAELVRMMVDSNTFYPGNAYTGVAYVDGGVNHSPMEALYAVTAMKTSLDGTWFLHRLVPFILIPAYLGIYQLVTGILCEEDKRLQQLVPLIVLGFLLLEAFHDGPIYLDVLATPWNGQTLLTSAVLPLNFAVAYDWLKNKRWQSFLSAAGLVVAGQLCYADGGAIVGVIWVIVVLIGFVMHMRERGRKI